MNASGDALLLFLALIAGARQQGDSAHIALCADGNRYRISVDAEGVGVAQKI